MSQPNEHELNVKALEMAIDMVEEQKVTINRIEAALSALILRVKNIESRVKDVPEDIRHIKTVVSELQQSTKKMRNELDIVTLDSNAQHQVYEHGQDVLEDWRAEMEADMIEPQITRTDIEQRTYEYNNRRATHQMHQVNAGYENIY